MASIKRYKTAKGTAWRVQYRSPDGRSRTKQGFRTKDQATAWADKNAVSVRENDWLDPNRGKALIGEIGEQWIQTLTHLKPSTQEITRQVWEGHVKPRWGNVPISAVTHSDVQAWVSGMGLSPSWVRHCHGCLSQVLKVAVADGRIRKNPCEGVRLPRRETTVNVYLTPAQLQALADACYKHSELVWLLGTAGLRWGEAVALRPRDLDPLRGRIHITRNAAKVGNKTVIGTPKSHEKRTVAVSKTVMEKIVGVAKQRGRDDLLWPSRTGTPLMAPGHDSWLDKAVKRCQADDPTFPRVTAHGLRHVAAGLLVNAGASVKVVQRQLGHKHASMTLDRYAELWDDGLDEISATVDGLFSAHEAG